MTTWNAVTQHFRDSGALCTLVPWIGFADEGIVLTKTGALLAVLAVDGIDYECLDPDEAATITARIESALRLWDEHTHVYQYLVKRPAPVPVDTAHADPRVRQLLERRRNHRAINRTAPFEVALYMAIVVNPPTAVIDRVARWRERATSPMTHAKAWLSNRETVLQLDTHLDDRIAQLRSRVDAFIQQLDDTLSPRLLNAPDAWRVLRSLVNYHPEKADEVPLRPDACLDFDAPDSVLECHRTHLRLDDRYVRVLTLKEPPAQTRPLMFHALFEVPSPCVLVAEWRREGQSTIRRELHARRRHFHNSKVSLTSYLSDNSQPTDLLVDESASAMVSDLGAALTDMTMHGRYFGHYTMTVVVHDTDADVLERSVGAVVKAFAAHDAQVTDERYNLLHAWMATLPGNSAYNLRSMYLTNANAADLALAFAQNPGKTTNAHLNREALAVLDSPLGTPYALNLHVGDVGHSLILGATGAGKSFLLNFLIAQLQRYSPRTLIFDLGGSYARLTDYFGGSQLRLRLAPGDVSINPFCLEPTPANLQFLFAFVKVLIQAGGQYAMTRSDDQDLYEQIETLYALDPDQRRLFTLSNILPRALAQQLQRWVSGGQYAHVFDHVRDDVTLASFQLIDFEGLDAVPLVLEPLLFYLLHRATATFLDPGLAATLKVFVIDEAWRFLRDPTIRAYVTEALKTWRKKNACVLLATQSSEDLQRSELLRVAIESCPTRIFLANPHIDQRVYRELFQLNEVEAARIASLIPRQQFLLTQPDVSKVLDLHVDQESAALFSASRA